MDLTSDQVSRIEAALEKLEEVDPAALPEPAAQLAELLGEILESTETS
jgi:hypothetical protein